MCARLTCMKLLHCGVASLSLTKSSGRAPFGTSRRVSQMLAFDTTDLLHKTKTKQARQSQTARGKQNPRGKGSGLGDYILMPRIGKTTAKMCRFIGCQAFCWLRSTSGRMGREKRGVASTHDPFHHYLTSEQTRNETRLKMYIFLSSCMPTLCRRGSKYVSTCSPG